MNELFFFFQVTEFTRQRSSSISIVFAMEMGAQSFCLRVENGVGRVVLFGVFNEQIEVGAESRKIGVLTGVKLFLHGGEIHGVSDDGVVIGNFCGIDGSIEERVLVFSNAGTNEGADDFLERNRGLFSTIN